MKKIIYILFLIVIVISLYISYNITLTNLNYKDIEKRLLFYWSKIYSKTIKEGKGYESLKKSIVVLILL